MNITWEKYHELVKELDRKIHTLIPSGPIPIIGIPRGGLLVALHLSYLDPRYHLCNNLNAQTGVKYIVVDDVLETGKTKIHWLQSPRINCWFAVLIDKSFRYQIQAADLSALQMKEKEWIAFPYEVDNQVEATSRQLRGY